MIKLKLFSIFTISLLFHNNILSQNKTYNREAPERPDGCGNANDITNNNLPKDRNGGVLTNTNGVPNGTYTKCTEKPASNSDYYCLPLPNGETSTNPNIPNTIDIERNTSSPFAVLSINVQNCRDKTNNKIIGNFSLIVDNSSSNCQTFIQNGASTQIGTDCANKRNVLAKDILGHLFDTNYANLNSTKVGIGAYGGMKTISNNTKYTEHTKQLNDIVYKKNCPNYETDNTGMKFITLIDTITGRKSSNSNDNNLVDYWREKTTSTYISTCEILPPAPITGDEETRQKKFLDYTSEYPRGLTDLTYFYDMIQRDEMLGVARNNTTIGGRHAIVITDGLPNISKKLPMDYCTNNDAKGVLAKWMKDDPNSSGADYCTDRQVGKAMRWSNQFLEGLASFRTYSEMNAGAYLADTNSSDKAINNANKAKFKEINVHNLLFLNYPGTNFVYVEKDYPTGSDLFTDTFLMEASARTGNGAAKWGYMKQDTAYTSGYKYVYVNSAGTLSEKDPSEWLNTLYEQFLEKAVHHVEITVNNNQSYNAVTNGLFDAKYSLKLVGLKDGANTVTIKTHYNNETITQTITVNVNAVSAIASPKCVDNADLTKTIDGDALTEAYPKGDGVLPWINTNTQEQCRIYRNNIYTTPGSNDSIASNQLPETELGSSLLSSDNDMTKRQKILNGKLRLQGGTGNCGVISNNRAMGVTSILLLLFLPISLLLFKLIKKYIQKMR